MSHTFELTLTLPCFSELFMPLISNHYLAIFRFSNSPARAHAFLLKTLRLPAVITFSKTKQWTNVSQASAIRYFWTGEAQSSLWMTVNLSKNTEDVLILYWILNLLFDLIILPLRPFYPGTADETEAKEEAECVFWLFERC